MSETAPQVGSPLPEFSMLLAVPQADGSIAEATLTNTDFMGHPSVLFFYPRDNTPGCTIEVCGFRDLYAEFQKHGIAVIGVSRDTLRAHHKFIQSRNLPYPLAADIGAEVIKSWGLLVNKTMYGKPVTGVARTTYIIDAQGVVSHIFDKVSPLGHARKVLDLLS